MIRWFMYFYDSQNIVLILDPACGFFCDKLSSVLFCNTFILYCHICTCHVWFYFTFLIVLNFAMRLKSTNNKSDWNSLVFYKQWKIMSDLNMSQGKMSEFCFIPMVWVHFSHKLRNFDFESHWNTLCFD